jgi:hypothetical protein
MPAPYALAGPNWGATRPNWPSSASLRVTQPPSSTPIGTLTTSESRTWSSSTSGCALTPCSSPSSAVASSHRYRRSPDTLPLHQHVHIAVGGGWCVRGQQCLHFCGRARGGRTARSNTGSGCIRSRDACFTGGTTQPGPQFLGFSAECLLLSDVLGQGVGGTGNRTDCLNCHRDLLSQFLVYP